MTSPKDNEVLLLAEKILNVCGFNAEGTSPHITEALHDVESLISEV